MKHKITSSILLMVPLFLFGQMINNFDAEPSADYWDYYISPNADNTLSFVNESYVTDPVFEGAGAMQLDYSVHNIEMYGGYVAIYHMLGSGNDEPDPFIAGTWMLAPEAGALMVGPAPNNGDWWSNNEADVTTRACLFDDEYVFNADGSFQNVLGDQTWIEGWQGGDYNEDGYINWDDEHCDVPIAPHDGSNAATWEYDGGSGTVTLNGVGAYLGLARVNNLGELPNVDVPESITYNITLSGNTMTLVIEYNPGMFFTFKLVPAESALAQSDMNEDWMTIMEIRNHDELWDWSGYDSISFSYYNAVPQSLEGRVHLRLNLSDFGDVEDPANYTGLGEYYYSFHNILDNEPGWNTITMPLERNDSWDGGGFNLTGWVGEPGNGELDKDAIAGFTFEFSIDGGGDGDYSGGTIILDDFTLTTQTMQEFGWIEGTVWDQDGNGIEGATVSVWNNNTNENNYSLSFDGASDFVGIDGLNISPAYEPILTVEAWVKLLSNDTYLNKIITNDNGGYDRALTISYGEYRIFAGRDIYTDIQATLNEWEHVAVTWTSTEITMFINGVAVFTDAGENITTGATITGIGGGIVGPDHSFDGHIDNVSLWSTIRSEEEISDGMGTIYNGNEDGLIGFWKFAEGTGSTTSDASSNGYDGTIYGAEWSDDVPFEFGNWSLNTGPDGSYSLSQVPPGEYEMGAYADGYSYDGISGVEVYPNETTYIDFSLEQEDQGAGTIHAYVLDHEGNPNDSAQVIFFSYENTVSIGVDGNGVASAELSPGPWSVFASDSDTSTWFDIWDGGVIHVEDGSTDYVTLFFYPNEEYGWVNVSVQMVTNDYSEPIMEAPVVIEDSEGNIHFEGYTTINGGIGEALLPGDDYLARVETEYGYQEQYFSVFVNSFNSVEFVFGGDPPDPALFGTWMMAPEANAVMAGPNPFDGSYFSNTEEDVDTFWCYYDDLYVFDEDGFHNDHDDQTWVEVWQGADQEGCGFPVYPHDGSSNPAGYDFGGGTLTLHGIGAYIGLPRAANGFELTSPDQAPESITYEVSFSYDGEIMYLVIEAGAGLFWTFKLIREDDEGDFTYLGEFDGSEYYLSDYEDTWTNANEWLQSFGVPEIHLVTIGSQEENDFLVDVYNEDEFWIGFTDQYEEGNWQWVTGEEVTYSNWWEGEPNNDNNIQHYGISNFIESGFWDDSENDILRHFIVEVSWMDEDESATILGIYDVPDDQGGRVYVEFLRSIHDTDSLRTAEMYTVERLDGDTWVGLNSVSAYGNDEYVVEATTLADSTSENDAIMTYRIIAAMEEGNFASEPESGYSVDNIAPGAPTGVVAGISDGVVYLEWAPSDANDLDYYAVYRSMDPEFLPGEESMIGSSEGSEFSDDVEELGDYYYAVTAFDVHENESDPSELVNVTLLSLEDIYGLPKEYALHQNYPNPFNPTTTLRYDLPEDATVSVVIYDMVGRQVRTLVSSQTSAGYHSIMWNATNNKGQSVSAGLYLYTIQSGDFRQVRKMVLLK